MSGEFRCGTVAIVGRPNVGKSTLLNHLVGQKVSITSSKAQTTRHRITGILSDDQTQFLFVDTPGLQKKHDNSLNRVLNRTVGQAMADADAIVFLLEAGQFSEADEVVLKQLPDPGKVVLAVSKCDKIKEKSRLMTFLSEVHGKAAFRAIVPVSVKQKQSLDELKKVIRLLLPVAPAVYGAEEFTDRSERFMAAEFIREKVFRQLGDELPYAVNVTIEKYEELGNLRRIFAAIVVEKSSQKAILIGEKGERLKRIGTDARKEMEETFGCKVYLELWVRIKKGWADDDALVRQYGYE
ncbi:MAG: GTPase Era [Betaproteobacteria bacterium]|nr:GTPase Era [Betaproteobacteria bacterium]